MVGPNDSTSSQQAPSEASRRGRCADAHTSTKSSAGCPGELATWIVAIAEQRDRAAFSALFLAVAPRIKSFLVKRGLANAAAEELCQDAMFAVWRKAAQFDRRRASAESWLFAITRNLMTDAYRKACVADAASRGWDPPDESTPPDAELLAVERSKLVHEALISLPVKQAQLVRSSFFGHRTHGEIAEEFGIPLGTVKSRLRSAVERMRAGLEGRV